MVINSDTLVVLTKNQLSATNFLLLDRELCWELNDSTMSQLQMAKDIIDKQKVSMIINDSINSIYEYELKYYIDDNSKLNKRVKRNRIIAVGSSSLSAILILIILAL